MKKEITRDSLLVIFENFLVRSQEKMEECKFHLQSGEEGDPRKLWMSA